MNYDGKIDFVCEQDITSIQLSKIKGFWYRRGKLSLRVNMIGEQRLSGLSEATNRFY